MLRITECYPSTVGTSKGIHIQYMYIRCIWCFGKCQIVYKPMFCLASLPHASFAFVFKCKPGLRCSATANRLDLIWVQTATHSTEISCVVATTTWLEQTRSFLLTGTDLIFPPDSGWLRQDLTGTDWIFPPDYGWLQHDLTGTDWIFSPNSGWLQSGSGWDLTKVPLS